VTQIAKVTASDAADSDYFGISVSIDGEYVVVGAYRDDDNGTDSGSAYLYKIASDDTVTQVAKLTASDADSYDYFGRSVSIDGSYVVVDSNSGSAYLYKIASDDSVTQTAKFTSVEGYHYYNSASYGSFVSVNGNYIVVGGTRSKTAYLYTIESDDTVSQTATLSTQNNVNSVSISGNTISLADTASKAHIFTIDSDGNVTEAVLSGALLGTETAVDGDNIVFGLSTDDTEYTDSGAVYLYEKDADQE